MKKILFTLIFLMCGSCFADEWKGFGSVHDEFYGLSNYQLSVQKAYSSKKVYPLVEVWIRREYDNVQAMHVDGKAFDSNIQIDSFIVDCKNKTYRLLASRFYPPNDEESDPIVTKEFRNEKWINFNNEVPGVLQAAGEYCKI